jgi:ribonuclease G
VPQRKARRKPRDTSGQDREILISVADLESRVALLEEGTLSEYRVQREPMLSGNIYKARVVSVLRGMDASFVDIGTERNAFLAMDDVMGDADEEIKAARTQKAAGITSLLKVGQELTVQVSRVPIGSKGARVTTRLALPGRYLVLMLGTGNYIGVSRKIEDEQERARLRKTAEAIRPPRRSLIVRTEGQGRNERELKKDLAFLEQLAARMQQKAKEVSAPALLHADVPLVFQFLRDVFGRRVRRAIVEPRDAYEEVLEVVGLMAPSLKRRVVLHQDKVPLFVALGIEEEVDKLLRRRVPLPDGSHITIDETEALTAIDVNTGRYVGGGRLADTVLHTNVQAAAEIARQLRLRNLGGIIVIDFIDMDNAKHRERVVDALRAGLTRDRARIEVTHISPLGLVEMTRKRVGANLRQMLTEACSCCGGAGRVLSPLSVALRVERELARRAADAAAELFLVRVAPAAALQLIGPDGARVDSLEKSIKKHVYIRSDPARPVDTYDIVPATPASLAQQITLPTPGQRVEAVVIQAPSNGVAMAVADGYHVSLKQPDAEVGAKVKAQVRKVGRSLGEAVPESAAERRPRRGGRRGRAPRRSVKQPAPQK